MSTISDAKRLLGATLIHEMPLGTIKGIIVETEAYLKDDPGSHASKGKTKRNEAMFGPSNTAYVYLIYGMYYCFNVVTNKEGIGEAVLIRAIEPLEGIDIMKENRSTQTHNLTNGPGKLTQAFAIKAQHNKMDLAKGKLRIEYNKPISPQKIVQTTRIGLSQGKELEYRFYIKDNKFVSKK